MKLDESVINKILTEACWKEYDDNWDEHQNTLREYLEILDLVIKPGDSSQGTLVENK